MKNEGKLFRAAYISASLLLSFFLWMVISLLLINGAIHIGNLISYGYFVQWERVETPAGKISDLRPGENGEVLLEMEDGRLYDWNLRSWNGIEKPAGLGPLSMGCKPGSRGGFYVMDSPFTPVESVSTGLFRSGHAGAY